MPGNNGRAVAKTMVGVAGLEPAASWSQTRRASQLRQTPIIARKPFRSGAQVKLERSAGELCPIANCSAKPFRVA